MVPREYRLCFSLSALLIFALFFVYVVVSSCVLYVIVCSALDSLGICDSHLCLCVHTEMMLIFLSQLSHVLMYG